MSSWSTLPRELLISIFEHIIDNDALKKSNKTVYNCLFVCKGWHSSAIAALYKKVYMNAYAQQFAESLLSGSRPGRFVRCITITSAFQVDDQPHWLEIFKNVISNCPHIERLYVDQSLQSTIWTAMLSDSISLERLKDTRGCNWDDHIEAKLYEKVAYKFRKTLTTLYIYNATPVPANADAHVSLDKFTSLKTLCICRGIYFSLKAICNMINSCGTLTDLQLGVFMLYGVEDYRNLKPNATVRRIQTLSSTLITQACVDFFNNFKALQELNIRKASFTNAMDEELWSSFVSLCLRVPKCTMTMDIGPDDFSYLQLLAKEASRLASKRWRRLFVILDEDCRESLNITAGRETFDLTMEVGELQSIEQLLGSLDAYNACEISVAHLKEVDEFVRWGYREFDTNRYPNQLSWVAFDSMIWHIDIHEERTKVLKLTEMIFCNKPEESNARTDKLDHLIFSASIFHTDMLPYISYRVLNVKTLTLLACHFLDHSSEENTLELPFSETKVGHLILYIRRRSPENFPLSYRNLYQSYRSLDIYPTFDNDEIEEDTITNNRPFGGLPLLEALSQASYCLNIKTEEGTFLSYRNRDGKINFEAGKEPADVFTLSIVCKDLQRLTIMNGRNERLLHVTRDEF